MKFSISSYNKANSCLRLYYIEKVLGYEDLRDKPWLQFGTAFDNLMELADKEGVETAQNSIEEYFRDEYLRANAEYLLVKWGKQYADDLQPPLDMDGKDGNQYEINIDLSHMVNDRFELIFTGFIDKVYSHFDEPAVNERKTTSDVINPNSAYWKRLLFDPQTVGYSYALSHEFDAEVNNGTYEVFRKPAEKIDSKLFKRDLEPDAYRDRLLSNIGTKVSRDAHMVARKPLYITQDMRDNWLYEFVNMAELIHDRKVLAESEDKPEYLWTRNKEHCDEFLGCPYKEFCGCQSDLENINNIYQKQRR